MKALIACTQMILHGKNVPPCFTLLFLRAGKSCLTMSDNSIAEIGLGVGFNDPNYFSRVFTQIIGISPTEYRRRFKSAGSDDQTKLTKK